LKIEGCMVIRAAESFGFAVGGTHRGVARCTIRSATDIPRGRIAVQRVASRCGASRDTAEYRVGDKTL
jgi:hypothetical protein